MKFLDKIKQKDNSQKESFALLVSLSITIFIFAIWSISMFYGILGGGSVNNKNVASPMEIFSENAIDGFKSLFSGKEIYDADNAEN